MTSSNGSASNESILKGKITTLLKALEKSSDISSHYRQYEDLSEEMAMAMFVPSGKHAESWETIKTIMADCIADSITQTPPESTEPTPEELFADWYKDNGSLVKLTMTTLEARIASYKEAIASNPIKAQIDSLNGEVVKLQERLHDYENGDSYDDDDREFLVLGAKAKIAKKQASIVELESQDWAKMAFAQHIVYPMYVNVELPKIKKNGRGGGGSKGKWEFNMKKVYEFTLNFDPSAISSAPNKDGKAFNAHGFLLHGSHSKVGKLALTLDTWHLFDSNGQHVGPVDVTKSQIACHYDMIELLGTTLGEKDRVNISKARYGAFGRTMKESDTSTEFHAQSTKEQIIA